MEARLVYSAPLLRRAVASYWKRSVGIVLPSAILLVVADLAFLLWRGDASWVVGVLATIVVVAAVFVTALYFVHYRNVFARFHAMGSSSATFAADESSFTVESGIGLSTFRWSAIREVWCFQDFWLLLFSHAQFMTLPLASVSAEMRASILERVRMAGGKVS